MKLSSIIPLRITLLISLCALSSNMISNQTLAKLWTVATYVTSDMLTGHHPSSNSTFYFTIDETRPKVLEGDPKWENDFQNIFHALF